VLYYDPNLPHRPTVPLASREPAPPSLMSAQAGSAESHTSRISLLIASSYQSAQKVSPPNRRIQNWDTRIITTQPSTAKVSYVVTYPSLAWKYRRSEIWQPCTSSENGTHAPKVAFDMARVLHVSRKRRLQRSYFKNYFLMATFWPTPSILVSRAVVVSPSKRMSPCMVSSHLRLYTPSLASHLHSPFSKLT
jgi:hypothetical protein